MARGRSSGRGQAAVEAVTEQVDGGIARLVPDRDRPRGWTLLIDDAPQSHVDLDDPAHLSFEYQRRFGHVVDLAAPPGKPLRAVHLGGGALTRPVRRRHPPPLHPAGRRARRGAGAAGPA